MALSSLKDFDLTMTPTESLPRDRRFLSEWLVVLGALLALGGYIGYLQYQEYLQTETQEREHLASQAAVIEKNLAPQLLLANRVMESILNDLPAWQADNDGFKRANHQLQVINDTLIGIRPILVIRADGTVIASSNEKLVGMNFAQREYFQTAIQNPDPAVLHVSAPFKTVLGTFVISLFRTIPGPNGTFAGIVIVSLAPEYFSILLDSVRYAPDMRNSIAHGDGKVFLTSPKTAEIEGMDLNKPGTFFRRHRESGQPANVFSGTVYVSGDERMIALRSIQLTSPPMDRPLVAAVSRSLAVIFASWRKSLYVQSIWFGVIAVFSTLGLWMIQRRRRDLSTERRLASAKINDLAFFDQLTNLPNRTLLLDRLKQTLVASTRSGNYGALLFIDLDNFKTLNDTLGHDMGDLLLKQVAQRLTRSVREGDTVARFGGDEFVVVLAGLGLVDGDAAISIEKAGEKILATLNQPYQLGDVPRHSTASIGITLFRGDLASIDDLMKQADLAMYKAKESGRNAWRFFDPRMESAVKELAALEDDLRRALDEKQFLLHYQAQVVGEARVTGAEVLVRWQHPERGMVAPAEFIPLAEKTGLILPLGHWVLQTACIQLSLWAGRPEMAHLSLAVNVSAHQFRQPDFVDQVLAVLTETGANPQRLKLELTESLLVHNVQEIIEKMFALKAKGVGFSLDDFGTGYSSLSYLKRLPLDQLKIDQGFVRDILIDPNDAAIAKMVIVLAESMGLMVIAEGVEIEAQREFLAHLGCHAYQGYLFSRPLPLQAFEAFMKRV
jgi:diguanylate cyclase (GGDEF)-like protein